MNSLDKVVIVYTANRICHEVVPDLKINTGEVELEKINSTRPIMTPTEVLEDDITTLWAGISVN